MHFLIALSSLSQSLLPWLTEVDSQCPLSRENCHEASYTRLIDSFKLFIEDVSIALIMYTRIKWIHDILTNMTVARQQFGKHISEVRQSAAGSLLLSNRSLGTFHSNGQNTDNNRRIHEMFQVVLYIRFAFKLVQSRRIQSQGILNSAFLREFNDSVCSDPSFVRGEDDKTLVVQ
jgi:hypothetical protein